MESMQIISDLVMIISPNLWILQWINCKKENVRVKFEKIDECVGFYVR